MIVTIFLVSMVTLPLTIHAQQSITFDHISLETEPRTLYIKEIIQDSKGMIWLGTLGGLVKYDGYTFTAYSHNTDDPNSISSNEVTALIEGSDGAIWVATDNGVLHHFDRNTGVFIRYDLHPPDHPETETGSIQCIFEDRQKNIWIGTYNQGLIRFDRHTREFVKYEIETKSVTHGYKNIIISIHEISEDKLLVGAQRRGLWEFDKEKKSFTFVPHLSVTEDDFDEISKYSFYESMSINALLKDSAGGLWLGSDNGLFYSSSNNGTFKRFQYDANDPYSFHGKKIEHIVEDFQGYVWVSTVDAGLSRYNRSLKRFEQFSNDSGPVNLSRDNISALYQDSHGTIWIGVLGYGLHKYSPLKQIFPYYTKDPRNLNSLSDPRVYSIIEDSFGTVWVGTLSGGLNRLDRRTSTFSHINQKTRSQNGLRNDTVLSLCEDDQETLWIGTVFGIDKLDLNTGIITHLEEDKINRFRVPESTARPIYMDRNGTMWMGILGQGLYQYDRKNDDFIRYVYDPEDPTSISSNTQKVIYHSRTEQLWIGTEEGGLNRFVPENESFIRYSHDPQNPDSLSDTWVYCIHEDVDGSLWLGTRKGINHFDPATGKATAYDIEDGLIDNVVYGILPESDHLLWLSTNKGLSRFNTRDKSFENFDHSYGLQDDEFNTGAYFRNSSGELFFGGQKGFHIFRPETIVRNELEPPIIFTSFKIYDDELLLDGSSAINLKETVFPHNSNHISLEFAALDFINPARNRYAYMLEGVDRDWVDAGTRRFVNYASLSPGTYTFRVKGANSHGIWNHSGASLTFTILPPFWATLWFRILIGILIIGAIISAFLIRTNSLRRQRAELAHQVDVRTNELKAKTSELEAFSYSVSHDLRTPVWHINLFGKLLRKNQSEHLNEEGKRHLEIIVNSSKSTLLIIEDLLYLALPENKVLRISPVDLSRLAKDVSSELIEIEPERDVDISIEKNLVAQCDERLIAIVLRNLFSNALKYTDSRDRAEIRFHSVNENGNLFYAVSDNGIGLQAEKSENLFSAFQRSPEAKNYEGIGVGLETCRRIINRHGGSIKAEGQENVGATFLFTLPDD